MSSGPEPETFANSPAERATLRTHTPGPWRVEEFGPPRQRWEVELCCIESHGYDALSIIADRDGHDDNPQHNARLIAAAPDMRAALVATEGLLQMLPGADQPDLVRSTLRTVRAAIAKARA